MNWLLIGQIGVLLLMVLVFVVYVARVILFTQKGIDPIKVAPRIPSPTEIYNSLWIVKMERAEKVKKKLNALS